MRGPEIVVVGAGIVGAAITWCLSRKGASVTVIDARLQAGGIATAASFAWINAANGNPRDYFNLRMRAIEGWRKWARDLPHLHVRLVGGISWELAGPDLEAYVGEYGNWGYPIRLVDRQELRLLEPALLHPPLLAALAEDEGMVEPALAADALINASGARLVPGTGVAGIRVAGNRAAGVETDIGTFEADAVVIAAGTGTPGLLAGCGIGFELDSPRGLLMATEPLERKLFTRLVISPQLHVRQRQDGSLLVGADFSGEHDTERPDVTARTLARRIRTLVGDEPPIAVAGYSVAGRPTPRDGFPALGPVPGIDGLHVAVTHSGVTLAPAIGDLLARQVLDGETDPFLERYAVARFIDAAGQT